ncbi:MAG: hypothetical protein Q4B16_08385 [Bacteroidia bacterium]|nr:hypothetical protein [Bacteroidia bacterium]
MVEIVIRVEPLDGQIAALIEKRDGVEQAERVIDAFRLRMEAVALKRILSNLDNPNRIIIFAERFKI